MRSAGVPLASSSWIGLDGVGIQEVKGVVLDEAGKKKRKPLRGSTLKQVTVWLMETGKSGCYRPIDHLWVSSFKGCVADARGFMVTVNYTALYNTHRHPWLEEAYSPNQL